MYHKKNGSILPRILSVILAAGLTLSSAVTYVGAAESDTSTSTAVEQENETAQEEHESAPAEEKEAPAEEQKSEGEGETDQSSEQDSEGEQDSEENHGADEEHVESPDTESDQQSGDDQKEAVEEQEDSGEEQAPEGEQNAEGEQDSEDGTTVQEGVETNPSDTTEDGTGDQAAAGEESEKKDEASESAVEGEEADAAADSTDAVNSGETTADVIEEPSEIQDIPGAVRMMEDSQAKNGWVEEDDVTRYYQNNEYVSNTVMEIEGIIYGFDYDGRMYNNEEFYIYNDEDGSWTYYRAQDNGALYREEWVDVDGIQYYYGANGEAVSGVVSIDGQQYLFSENGSLLQESAYRQEEEQKLYRSNSEGVVTELNWNGWSQFENHWYYATNGDFVTDQVRKIGNDYYAFRWDGTMLDNESDSVWSSKDEKYYYYRAKKDGILYVNQWYEEKDDWGSTWYYYGPEGQGVSGKHNVNGVDYLFYSDGQLWYNGLAYDDKDKVRYASDDEGKAYKWNDNGWNLIKKDWFYAVDGEKVEGQVKEIGGSLYCFDWNGRMYNNEQFWLWNEETDGYIPYCAKSGGALYRNEWYADNYDGGTNWYYYKADGTAASGPLTVSGKLYVFDEEGRMMKDSNYSDESGSYLIGQSGAAVKVGSGWLQVDSTWYYGDANGHLVTDTVTRINGNYYGFDYNGKMYDNTSFGDYNEESDQYLQYRAKSGGRLYVAEWFKDSWGNWFYYGSDAAAVEGKQSISGKDYFFDDGVMVDDYYILVDGVVYHADRNGYLSKAQDGMYTHGYNFAAVSVKNGSVVENSWVKNGSDWYYFGSDGGAYTELKKIGSDWYYFNDNGVMQSNGWIYTGNYYDSSMVVYADSAGHLKTGEQKINGKWYYFTDTGVLQTGIVEYNGKTYLCGKDGAYIKTIVKDGWEDIQGTWYYWENGEHLTGTEKTINGKTYYFDYDGMMVKNRKVHGKIFDANGCQVKSGWYLLGDAWTYVDPETGEYFDYGEKTISGKQYFFEDGEMVVGEFVYGNELRTYGPQGNLISRQNLNTLNGWKLFDGTYFYYKNGEPFSGWVGNYYVEGGMMQTDSVIDGYYVNDQGLWVKKQGWISRYHGSEYMYVKANGKVADDEWVSVGGSWYYFSGYTMLDSTVRKISGKEYVFASSGKLALTVDPAKKESKWVSVDGSWYYIDNGELVEDGECTIGGKTYLFESYRMCTNEFAWTSDGSKYADANGIVQNYTGWKMINGKWFWFNQDHAREYGWLHIGDRTYYINGNSGMLTGAQLIDGDIYHFSSSGALEQKDTIENGWVQAGGEWYYYVNNSLVRGKICNIGGVYYGFDGDGSMVRNGLVDYEYYVDASGKVSFSSGWRKIDGRWYYFGTGGRLLRGLQMINGKMYNLDTYY